MTGPRRLLEGEGSRLERELLLSAAHERPRGGGVERTLVALGLGTAAASTASAAAAGLSASGAAGSSGAAASGAAVSLATAGASLPVASGASAVTIAAATVATSGASAMLAPALAAKGTLVTLALKWVAIGAAAGALAVGAAEGRRIVAGVATPAAVSVHEVPHLASGADRARPRRQGGGIQASVPGSLGMVEESPAAPLPGAVKSGEIVEPWRLQEAMERSVAASASPNPNAGAARPAVPGSLARAIPQAGTMPGAAPPVGDPMAPLPTRSGGAAVFAAIPEAPVFAEPPAIPEAAGRALAPPAPPAPAGGPAPVAPAAQASSAMGPPTVNALLLTSEVAWMDCIRAELAERRASHALSLLRAYQQEFPTGRLAPESELLRVQALVETGALSSAAALGEKLLAAHPSGPYASQIRALLTTARNRSSNSQ